MILVNAQGGGAVRCGIMPKDRVTDRPPLRPCPRCRITMQAGRSDPASDEYDTFTCLRCDLVLSYAHKDSRTRRKDD